MQAGLERCGPYTDELFTADDLERSLAADGVAVEAASLASRVRCVRRRGARRGDAGPTGAELDGAGGRQGIHTEPFGCMLAEMQHLHRSHPGASW